MKTILKKKPAVSAILAAALMFALATATLPQPLSAKALWAGGPDIDAVIEDTAAFIKENVAAPGIGQIGGDWAVIALMRSGAEVSASYVSDYYDRVADELITSRGILSSVKYSEYSRVALAILSIGADPRDVGGYDLLAPLLDFDATANQGINGPIFALIALDAAGFDDALISFDSAGYDDAPTALGSAGYDDEQAAHDPAGFDDAQIKERYIEHILSKQLDDGGFTLSGTVSDPDTTGMALTALSNYKDREEVAEAIDRALSRLSKLQKPEGGFTSFSSTNSESVSQVIIALCSLGIPIDDARFVKEGNTLLSNLLGYYAPGLGIEHELAGGNSLMATEQALCALAALRRAQNGSCGLYDMSDSPKFAAQAPGVGLAGKNPGVSVPGITQAAPEFGDIVGHVYEEAVAALYARGIISGYTPECFAPDVGVTRAEMVTLIVRSLGLGADRALGDTADPGGADGGFGDVSKGDWFYGYVSAAGFYGIVKAQDATGNGSGFGPDAPMTRQEAALLVFRAASLCGLAVGLDDTAIRNILSPFSDYRSVSPWAAEALAFCCYFGIIDDQDIELNPNGPALRGEAADMVYRMLRKAKLA